MSVAYDPKVRTTYTDDVPKLRAAPTRDSLEVPFTPSLPDKGYTRRTLFIDLDTMTVKEKPITEEMIDVFTGGRGFGLYYLWHAITPQTKWNDPDNTLVISPGPIAGNPQYAGSGKSLVVTLSPMTGIPIDCNVGGYFGPFLKFCGFDALEIRGKARNETIVVIDGPRGMITIEEAPEETTDSHIAAELFTHMYADGPKDFVNVAVVSAGKAAESAYMGCLNFSWYEPKRGAVRLKQAGRGGTGTVFRDKKLKALVIRSQKMASNLNNAADLPTVIKVGKNINQEIHDHDDEQCRMRRQGTAHLVETMDAYDLLPVHTFHYGNHPDTPKIDSTVWDKRFTQGIPDRCWYGPRHGLLESGRRPCRPHGPLQGGHRHGGRPGQRERRRPRLELRPVRSGLAARGELLLRHLRHRHDSLRHRLRVRDGMLGEGHPQRRADRRHRPHLGQRRVGSRAASPDVARRGFRRHRRQGRAIHAEPVHQERWGDPQYIRDIGMQIKGLEIPQDMSKESLAQQGGYALANKGPQHDEAWLIFMDMVNNQIPNVEDKAEALHYFPLFRTLVRPAGAVQAPVERHRAARQPREVPGARGRQGARARR